MASTSGYADLFDPALTEVQKHKVPSINVDISGVEHLLYGRFGRANDVQCDGEVAAGKFEVWTEECNGSQVVRAKNHGVDTAPYMTAIVVGSSAWVRELNRHPDGEQMFVGPVGSSYKLLVAPPTETNEIDPNDLVVLEFAPPESSIPFYIHRNTWHQPPFVTSSTTMRTAQAKSHECVVFDSVDMGYVVEFPLYD